MASVHIASDYWATEALCGNGKSEPVFPPFMPESKPEWEWCEECRKLSVPEKAIVVRLVCKNGADVLDLPFVPFGPVHSEDFPPYKLTKE